MAGFVITTLWDSAPGVGSVAHACAPHEHQVSLSVRGYTNPGPTIAVSGTNDCLGSVRNYTFWPPTEVTVRVRPRAGFRISMTRPGGGGWIDGNTYTAAMGNPKPGPFQFVLVRARKDTEHANIYVDHFFFIYLDVVEPDDDVLTAEFRNVPYEHRGSKNFGDRNRFTTVLAFNHNITTEDFDLKFWMDNNSVVTNGELRTGDDVDNPGFSKHLFLIRVTPWGNADVTIRLPTNERCLVRGAPCTADGKRLSNDAFVTIPGPGRGHLFPRSDPPALKASFIGVPKSHDGSSDFILHLSFNKPIVTSYQVLRDHAFTVTGGTVTEAKRMDTQSDLWEIRVTPSGSGPVTVNLPETTGACNATGAICTAGGLKLSAPVEAEIAGPPTTPLTASFEEVPPAHDGSSAFTLELVFSEEPEDLGFRTVRNSLFTVSGGTITRAKRTTEGSSRRFRLTVEPSGNGAVALALATSRPACGQSGAVCASGGRSLTGPLGVTVKGPPSLAVEDAAVDEGRNAVLAFAVKLSHAAAGAVTVDWATSDQTAVAGQDYTAASGTLSFAAGETEKTVSVSVLDDVHNDPGETLTLTLSNPSGASIRDGTAKGTIRNSDAMPRAWLARFGRTVAEQVIEAMEGRMNAARTPGAEMSLAGQSIGPGAGPDDPESREAAAKLTALTGWLRGEDDGNKASSAFGFRPVTARDLMTGSSFKLTGGTAEGGFGAVWGRGAVTRFDGGEGDLTLDGEVASGVVGVDFARGRSMAGLAVAHSRGEGGYRGPIRNGEVESTLTGLFPWGSYAVSERLTVWGMAGYGSGRLTYTPEGMPAMETDMDLAMGAVGGRGVLVKAAAEGGLELAAKTDALLVRTTSDEVDGSAGTLASEADVTRVRLGLEGAWRGIGTGGGGALVPRLEVGVRQDGGDAETGGGMDVGAGLSWTQPSLGIRAEVRGRGLLTHTEEGFRQRGFAGSLAWDPDPDSERGPSLTLSQIVGAHTSGGMEALLRPGNALGAANDGGDDLGHRRLEVKLGYGFALFDGRWTGVPELGLGWSETVRETTLGWRLAGARQAGMAFEVEAARRQALSDTGTEHRLGMKLTARW